MRLVDADALIDYLQIIPIDLGYREVEEIEEYVMSMPTIEPQRTGKWERHYSRPNVYADLYWHCSECGYKNDDQYANVHHKFCPNCGCRMTEDTP